MFCEHRELAEREAKLIEEETARRVAAAIEARVAEVMASDAVQLSLDQRLVAERKILEEQVQTRDVPGPHRGIMWPSLHHAVRTHFGIAHA